jgi:anti-sigma factor RsiW
MAMNHDMSEELSALVDGELARSETAFMLRRLGHDAGLRARYARYHLIRDCLRSPTLAMPALDLAARVQAALAAEPAPRRALPWRMGLQYAAGFFTAAVVAAGAFWYVQPQGGDVDLAAAAAGGPSMAQQAPVSQVRTSGVAEDDLRRQLPLLPVSAQRSRLLQGEFAPQPDPEAWQRAAVTPLHYPSTQYIIVLPPSSRAPRADAEPAPAR